MTEINKEVSSSEKKNKSTVLPGEPLVEIKNVSVDFPIKKPFPWSPKKCVQAVTNVSLVIKKGQTFGVVGESGCGKTTLANTTIGLVTPTKGEVLFKGKNMFALDKATVKEELDKMEKTQLHNKSELRVQKSILRHKPTAREYSEMRRDMQMIFQDPFSSLSPRMEVLQIIGEPMMIRGGVTEEEVRNRILELLKLVGLDKKDLHRHASDFSGGQRQRLCIARALSLNPEYLVCDEPVSALDVSVHAQILNLLMELQKKLGLTYLFISHNLAVVKHVCTDLAVMYLGKIAESGKTDKIFKKPLHPYTRALMSSVLDIDSRKEKERLILQGDIPSPIDPPVGCRFHQRCPEKIGMLCETFCPTLFEIEPEHFVACHLYHHCRPKEDLIREMEEDEIEKRNEEIAAAQAIEIKERKEAEEKERRKNS